MQIIQDVLINLDLEYNDERGSIIPLADLPMKSCVLIISEKDTVRANHYHKTDGIFEKRRNYYYHRDKGSTNIPEKIKIKKGQLFSHLQWLNMQWSLQKLRF